MRDRPAEELEEDTMVPLGHEGNGKRGRQCVRTGRVGEEPKEAVPVAGRVELVGLVVVWIGFPDDSSFLEFLTLLLAAAAVVAAAAVGRGVRSVHV